MEDSTSSPKFKVVMGSGPSQTIKRLNKSPENYEQLTKMIKSKLSERLFNNHSFYIYYENISNEMIKIEDDIDLECAIDSCTGKEKHSIKLHIYLEPIEDSKEQSDYKSTDPDRPSDDNYSDFCESEEIKRILQDHPFRPGELQQIGQLYKDSIARAREEL